MNCQVNIDIAPFSTLKPVRTIGASRRPPSTFGTRHDRLAATALEPTPAQRTDAAWLEAHWMPYTGNRSFKADPRIIVEAKGAYFTDADGRKIFDGLSGLWCSGLGHGRPEITEAVSRQIARLDYSPAFQFGHPLSFELANKIKELTPAGLDYVFFTGSGSEAADTSLKMARAYWRTKGQASKTRLIGREKGYHGVNYGGISVGGIAANRKLFGQGVEADHLPHTQLASERLHARHGRARRRAGRPPARPDRAARRLEHRGRHRRALLGLGRRGDAAKGYLKRLRDICTANNILLIFDEVITGFGRCGALTGAEAFGVTPDIMNIAKQVTNGAQPMGAVVASKDIYDTFMAAGGPDYMLEFPHGYTYSRAPGGLRRGHRRARGAAEGRHGRPRAGAGAALRERGAQPEGQQARDGHPQLRPGRRPDHCSAARRACAPPVRDRDELLEEGLLRALRRRHHPAGPPFISEKAEIDRMVNALADALAETA
jgi:beta-alanine--pyruvate transaminase